MRTGNRLPTIAGIALLAVACSGGEDTSPVAPQDATLAVTQDFVPLDGVTFWNSCVGEYVRFESGSIQHVAARTEPDGAGGYHLFFHRNGQDFNGPGLEWNGVELVPTGTYYTGNSVLNYTENVKPPFPAEYTFTSRVRLIQQGPGPKSFVNILDHITVNADGEITADVLDVFVTCK